MILGNPYKFSIITQTIEHWNYENASFHNGILFICIDGELFPQKLCTSTLSREIAILKEQLMNLYIDKQLFYMNKEDAFHKIYTITFPDDINIDNDYRYDITPDSIADRHYCIFAVRYGENVRFLASKCENNSYVDVKDTVVTFKYINDIVSKLKIY